MNKNVCISDVYMYSSASQTGIIGVAVDDNLHYDVTLKPDMHSRKNVSICIIRFFARRNELTGFKAHINTHNLPNKFAQLIILSARLSA